MTTDLRARLQAADPARPGGYDADRCASAVAAILARDAATSVPGSGPVHRRSGSGRPASRRGLAIAGGALAVAVALVAVPALLPDGEQGASTAAASVLGRAASITAVDPPTRPGQYWRIVTTGIALTMATGAPGTADGGVSAWLTADDRTAYVAVDGTRPTWITDTRGGEPRQIAGPPGRPAPQVTTWTMEQAVDGTAGGWQAPTPAFLAALPRDPAALRRVLYRDSRGHGRSVDGEVLVQVADVLRSGLVPADLRASLFRVLATVPGVTVTAASVTVAGRAGVAIGRLETVDGERQELVVDPRTGEVIAERTIQVRGVDGIPAGTVTGQVRTTRSVVDDVPAAVRAAGRQCSPVKGLPPVEAPSAKGAPPVEAPAEKGSPAKGSAVTEGSAGCLRAG